MTAPGVLDAPRVRDRTLSSVVRRWYRSPVRTIASLVGVMAITFGVYLSQPPRFEARADVVVVAIPSFSIQGSVGDMSVDSAVRLLTSDQVLGETARELDYPGGSPGLMSDLIISPVVNSRILRLYVRNEDPDFALSAVKSLSDELLEARTDRLELTSKNRLDEIEARLVVINAEIDALTSDVGSQVRDQVEVARLVEERTALESESASIRTLPTEAGFISRAAVVEDQPTRPYAPMYIGSGLAIGLCVAWFIAPAKRTTNDALESGDDA